MAVVNGTIGNDTLLAGTASADTISGLDGNDFLSGLAAQDVLFGGNGNDTLSGGSGIDTLDGGVGIDTADYSASTAAVTVTVNGAGLGGDAQGDTLIAMENILGSAFNDSLTGDSLANALYGGALNDTLIGGLGADTLDGGTGIDTVSYATSLAGVTITIGGAAGTGGDAAGDLLTAVEIIIGSGLNDALTGDVNANALYGGVGNDTLIGLGGADTLDGGTGTDTVSYAASAAGVTITVGGAAGTGGDAAGDLLTAVEILIGSGLADALTGDATANSLFGGVGNDTLIGLAGADTLDGGTGTDTVSYAASAAGVTITIGGAAGTGGDAAGDVLTTVESIIGSGLNDALTGDLNANSLFGGVGSDTLIGGAGSDTLDGGTGTDVVDYAASAAGVTIAIGGAAGVGGDAAGDLLTTVENIVGSGLNDALTGDVNANGLYGGVGNDTLAGLGGADTLDGGAGMDTVSYAASAAGVTLTLGGAAGVGGDAAGDVLTAIEAVIGSGQNDVLTGDTNANGLYGGGGSDTIIGGAGADTLDGGTGTDLLSYATATSGITVSLASGTGTIGDASGDVVTGFENVLGSGLNDVLTGDATANALYGGTGSDTLNGGALGDTLDGGTGDSDAVSYAGSTVEVVIDLSLGTATGGDAAGDVLTGFENIIGSTLNDTLVGDIGANVLTGGEGSDVLDGDDGLDTADYGFAAAAVHVSLDQSIGFAGEAYLDTLINIENLAGSGFNDTLQGDGLANVLSGAGGDDSLDGDAGDDTLYGGTGDDSLYSGIGTDHLDGGAGNDTYFVASTTAVITESASAGTDSVQASVTYTLADNVENLTLTGGANLDATGNTLNNLLTGNSALGGTLSERGDNTLNGMAGDDTLMGGGGNDSLNGGAGNDSMVGGTGNDTFVVDAATDVVVEAASEGTDLVRSFVAWTLGVGQDNLTLIGTASINGIGNELENTMTGNTGANSLSGLAGDDALSGGDGNDTLDGGTGADTLTGGLGDDLFIVDDSGERVVESAGGGNDQVESSISYILASNVESLILTGSLGIDGTGNTGDNTITGNNAANVLEDGFGNDTLFGGGGNDTLNGGTGTDSLVGGIGDDTYVVDLATDIIVEGLTAGTDTVQTIVAWTLGAHLENLTLTGSSGITGTGNALANVIVGNARGNLMTGLDGNDTLDGGAGADTLDGGIGADSMTGGDDNDTFIVDDAGDVVVEIFEGGTDTVLSVATFTLGAEVENLTLTGGANVNGTGTGLVNVLIGNTGANVLSGLGGVDTLDGGLGNDTLDGGTGGDSMTGGGGNDVYIVDDGGDRVVETSTGGFDRVEASITHTLALYIENLTLTGIDAINGTGNILANTMTGNTAANLLSGGSANDTIFGGTGDDTLDGGTGTDSVVGGIGNDTFVVDAITDIIVEDAGAGTDLVQSSVVWTLGANLENLTLLGTTSLAGTGNVLANILTGNTRSNRLSGLDGNDTLDGGIGTDTLDGGIGADSMIGGADNDLYIVDDAGDAVVELAGGGIDTVQTAGTYTLVAEVENLTLTGVAAVNGTGNGANNTLTGNVAANLLSGLAGNDTLIGGEVNDTLDGGEGTDSMVGGLGDDVFVVDATTDRVSELAGGGTDRVEASITLTLASNIENLTLTGTDAINGLGNTVANIITGNTAANLLNGGSGNDTMYGSGGNDTLDGAAGSDSMGGGAGDDTYLVDVPTDFAFEDADAGTDLVQSAAAWTLATNFENLLLTGSIGVSGTGNAVDNLITGNSRTNLLSGLDGNDTLRGEGGNDSLVGGAGNDVLTGGAGADAFVFNTLSGGTDTITDFNGLNGVLRVGDQMRFEGLLSGTFAYIGADGFAGIGNSQARVDGGNVLVDSNGDGTVDITIGLTGLTSALQLVASDFVFT